MNLMVKTITILYDRLKDEYSDRLELIEIDEEKGMMLATLDGKPFEIDYIIDKYLKLMVSPENEIVLELLKPSLRKLTNNFPGYYCYQYYADGSKTSNLMWNFVDSNKLKQGHLKDDLDKGKSYSKK